MRGAFLSAVCLATSAFLASPLVAQGTASKFKVSPATLAFAFTLGDPKLPAAQTLSISGATGGTQFTGVVSGGPWLTVSPLGGTTPVSAKVTVNPTTLPVGNYSGVIALRTTGSAPETIEVRVTLVVKSPPSTLEVAPNPVAVTYGRGEAAPEPIALGMTTSDEVLQFSATVGGGTWLTATPRSGAVFPGFPVRLTLTIKPAGLAPGSYKSTVAIAAPQAANKTITVNVNLTVNPGRPSLEGVWPNRITQGAGATTITVTGANFFSGSVVLVGSTELATAFLGTNALTAVIPANLLAAAGTLAIGVTNPGQGGGSSGTETFTVLDSNPVINAISSAASFQTGAFSPGEMLTIFGTGLGPDALANFVPPNPGGAIATTLGGTRIFFDGTAAPILYTSATQVAVLAPNGLAGRFATQVRVEYNGNTSGSVSSAVVPARPGIFTTSGTGTGPAVVFNYDEAAGLYSVNSDSAQATKGSVIVFYVTGAGAGDPPGVDGQIATQAVASPRGSVQVHIGGADSEVLYAGTVAGLSSGIIQVNARIPQVQAGKQTPLLMLINGAPSQDGVTVSVK